MLFIVNTVEIYLCITVTSLIIGKLPEELNLSWQLGSFFFFFIAVTSNKSARITISVWVFFSFGLTCRCLCEADCHSMCLQIGGFMQEIKLIIGSICDTVNITAAMCAYK